MALDRFIVWKDRKPKSPGEIATILMGYLGGAATEFNYNNDEVTACWTVSLPGIGTNALAQVGGAGGDDIFNKDRWFEIHLCAENMDVITRLQDPFVNAIAEGFAALIARWYGGDRDAMGH